MGVFIKLACLLVFSFFLNGQNVAQEGPEDIKKRRQELLQEYDKNKDGRLDKNEREALRKERPSRQSRNGRNDRRRRGGFRWPEEVVKRFDENGDGKLDDREGKIAGDTLRARAAELEREYDANGNGRFDGDEWNKLGRDVKAGKVKDVPFWFRWEQNTLKASKLLRWETFDLNKDGRLNEQELRVVREKLKNPDEGTRVEVSPTRVVTREWPPERDVSEDSEEENADREGDDPPKPKIGKLNISRSGGFYSKPIEIQLSVATEGSEIRYTLDSSEPTLTNGSIYKEPIKIDKTTVLRTAAFKDGFQTRQPKTRTYIYLKDVIHQSADGLPPANAPYRWGRNLVDYGMDPEVVKDPAYKDKVIDALKSLPSISLVVDPDKLFGEYGIYAYARMSGREAERMGSLEVLTPNLKEGMQVNCGVRIRGGFSRTSRNPKHGFRLFFRRQYGPGKLRYPMFGKDAAQEFDNVDLRCSQNYSWNMGGDERGLFVRDQFSRDLQLAMGQPAARGDYYHLYLNGQYWGLFNSCERAEASYGASYFGGTKEEYDVIKMERGRGTYATDGDMEAWTQLQDLLDEDLSKPEHYQRLLGNNPDGTPNPEYETYVDVDNLIDYMLIIFWSGNLDAPVTWFARNRHANNWYGIRNRNGKEGFRYFIWDAEHTLLDTEVDRTGPFPAGEELHASNPQWVWQRCLDNEEFRIQVQDHIEKRFKGVLSVESLTQRFKKRTQEIEQAVICESARWGDAGRANEKPRTRDQHWRKEVKRVLEEFVPRRHDVVLQQLWEHGLISDLKAPTIETQRFPASKGEVVKLGADQGEVYYTTDGTDPRQLGGGISKAAKKYSKFFTINEGVKVSVRVKSGEEWSPLKEVTGANPEAARVR